MLTEHFSFSGFFKIAYFSSPFSFSLNYLLTPKTKKGIPSGSSGKESVCQCRRHKDVGLIPGSGRSPGGGHGNPLQYSCLQNHIDKGAWQTIVHGVSKNQTQLNWLSMHAYIYVYYTQDGCNITLVGLKSDKQKCIQNLCIREKSLNQSH